MKKAYLLVLIILILNSCKKQADIATTILNNLQGSWELRSSFNGWIGTINYPAGNGHNYVFTGNTYKIYDNGTITKQGTYVLTQQFSTFQNRQVNSVVFDHDTSVPVTTIDLNGDQLTLSIEAYDAGGSVYQRME